jgi:membrane dipeptidase
MHWVDLHCDTLTACYNNGKTLCDADGHIRIECIKETPDLQWSQVFAIFLREGQTIPCGKAYFMDVFDWYIPQKHELKAVCNPILSVENAGAMVSCPEEADFLAEHGVRMVSLTWNGANPLGFGNGCGPDSGLTSLGKAFAERCLARGMLLDVSHLNKAGFWDLVALAEHYDGYNLLASHSKCQAVCAHPRNLDDKQIRAIRDLHGLIGLNFYPPFLGPAVERFPLKPGMNGVARHLRHLLEFGCLDCVALGTDFDGCETYPYLSGTECLPTLLQYLTEWGFTKGQLESFFFANAERFLSI